MSDQQKQQVTPEWIERMFGSASAWRKSLTKFRFVKVGKPRRPAIHIRLMPSPRSSWWLPCPDRPTPAEVCEAVSGAVLGFGVRPRVAYRVGDEERIAVGRRGESSDRLRVELVQTYGLVWTADVACEDGVLADYAATGGNYRPHARRLRMRDEAFLAKAVDPAEVERSALLDDRQFERVWRLHPEYVGDGLRGDPGEWAQDEVRPEVVIADPGGRPEAPPPLPPAIPKADGRGKESMYFGYGLDRGGGWRFRQEEFEPPLRIALGGVLNRARGYGGSEWVSERFPYAGDGFHWGRNSPLAKRVVGPDSGPVFGERVHPEPQGRWYAWLGTAYQVPEAIKWESWMRRAAVYERERKKVRDREAKTLPSDPPCVGATAKAA